MNLKGDGFFNILSVQTKNKSKTSSMNLSKESKLMSFSLIGFMLIPLKLKTPEEATKLIENMSASDHAILRDRVHQPTKKILLEL